MSRGTIKPFHPNRVSAEFGVWYDMRWLEPLDMPAIRHEEFACPTVGFGDMPTPCPTGDVNLEALEVAMPDDPSNAPRMSGRTVAPWNRR